MTEHAVSPTEIEDMVLCPRKWAWRQIDKIRFPSHPSAAFGTAVHDQLERWFKKGIRPDANTDPGRVAESCLHFWPVSLVSETEFWISVVVDGVSYRGRQDIESVADPAQEMFEAYGNGPQECGYLVPVVGDFKTTGKMEYAKDADTLLSDPQAMIYLAASMERNDATEGVLRWTYMKRPEGAEIIPTKAGQEKRKVFKSQKCSAVAGKEHVFGFISKYLNPLVRQMNRLRKLNARALSLPPDANACGAFGGCAYRDMCKLSEREKLHSIRQRRHFLNGDGEMGLKDRIAARTAQLTTLNPPEQAKPEAKAQPTSEPLAVPKADKPLPSIKEKLAAAKAASDAKKASQKTAEANPLMEEMKKSGFVPNLDFVPPSATAAVSVVAEIKKGISISEKLAAKKAKAAEASKPSVDSSGVAAEEAQETFEEGFKLKVEKAVEMANLAREIAAPLSPTALPWTPLLSSPDRMNFGEALTHMKGRRRVTRLGWNGKGMFLFRVQDGKWSVSLPLEELSADDLPCVGFIAMKTSDNKIVPWLASQTDILADDWVVL